MRGEGREENGWEGREEGGRRGEGGRRRNGRGGLSGNVAEEAFCFKSAPGHFVAMTELYIRALPLARS